MNAIGRLSFFLTAIALLSFACEPHDFSETSQLHGVHGEGHGDHHGGDSGHHGAGDHHGEGHRHGGDGHHGDEHAEVEKKGDARAEKKAETGEPRSTGI